MRTRIPPRLSKSNRDSITGNSVVSVNRAGLRETVTGLVDKLSCPQPAKGLVAGHVGMIIEVGENFPEIIGTLGIRGVQEPELSQKVGVSSGQVPILCRSDIIRFQKAEHTPHQCK